MELKIYSENFEHPQLITPTNNKGILMIATNDYNEAIIDGCDESIVNSIEKYYI